MKDEPDGVGVGIGKLTAAELGVLRLLAQGHTIKSIADVTGQTEHAVNERLRSARRKCGVGSSRELARLVDVQKSRDLENRTPETTKPEPRPEPRTSPSPTRRWRSEGVVLMVLSLVTAAALVFQAARPTTGASAAAIDPVIESLTATPVPDLRQLHALTHAAGTNPSRSTADEQTIRAAYQGQPAIAKGVTELKVACGADVCEVSGKLVGRDRMLNPAMDALQGKALGVAVRPTGLNGVTTTFGAMAGQADQQVFAAYWMREGEAQRLSKPR